MQFPDMFCRSFDDGVQRNALKGWKTGNCWKADAQSAANRCDHEHRSADHLAVARVVVEVKPRYDIGGIHAHQELFKSAKSNLDVFDIKVVDEMLLVRRCTITVDGQRVHIRWKSTDIVEARKTFLQVGL